MQRGTSTPPRAEGRAAPAAGPVRCVVLCAAGHAPPSVLLTALGRRGVDAILTTDPFAAMLALARSANDSSLAPDRHPALIVVEPARHGAGALEDLLDAATRRNPGLLIWEYDERERPPLRAWVRPGSAKAPANEPGTVVVPARSRHIGKPALRLTDAPLPDSPAPAPGAPKDEHDLSEPPENLLSDEELSMLLADDPNDHDPR